MPDANVEDIANWDEAAEYVDWLLSYLVEDGERAAAKIREAARLEGPREAEARALAYVASEAAAAAHRAEGVREAARSQRDQIRDTVAVVRASVGEVAVPLVIALARLRVEHDDLDALIADVRRRYALPARPDVDGAIT